MTTRVFYWSWQLECCGDGFALGDRVTWTAIAAPSQLAVDLGATEAADIAWCEEHHPSKKQRVSTIEGTVSAIRAIWQKYEPSTGATLVPVTGASKGADVAVADGRVTAEAEYSFTGYVVTLQ